MPSGRDDDALTWGGDDDPTLDLGSTPETIEQRDAGASLEHVVADSAAARPEAEPETPIVAPPAALPDGFVAVGKGSDRIASGAAALDERVPLGNATLVALGLFGGVYLLYAIGWLIGGLRLQNGAAFLVSPTGESSPLWSAGNWVALVLAVLAPVIWFAVASVLSRRGHAWMLWVGLIAGAVLLVPWPFVMAGAVGA